MDYFCMPNLKNVSGPAKKILGLINVIFVSERKSSLTELNQIKGKINETKYEKSK
jgi:hypothetical protein